MGKGNAEMQKYKEVPELFFFSVLVLSLIKPSYSKKEWRGGDKRPEDCLFPTVGYLHSYNTLTCSSVATCDFAFM